MRVALAVLLMMLCVAATAAPVSIPCKTSSLGGPGTPLRVRTDATGWSYGYACPPGPGTLFQAWGLWADALPDWEAQTANAVAGGDAALAAFVTSNLTQAPKDANGAALFPNGLDAVVLGVHAQIKIDAATLPVPVPPSGYVVRANGTAATRVVYSYVAATRSRGAVTSMTVPVGAPCDASITVTERIGTLITTYMGVPGGIAVCVPAP